MSFKLYPRQAALVDYVVNKKTFKPIFISGSAGTGKSFLLRSLRKKLTAMGKQVIVVSLTAVAAMNVDGKTCHSAFRFNFNSEIPEEVFYSPRSFKNLRCVSYLIIDEVSMLNNKLLEGMERVFRFVKRNSKIFGGVNVVAFGDLHQLPCIHDENNPSLTNVYKSPIWKEFQLYLLEENMRQSEEDFITALNLMRKGVASCLDFFNYRAVDRSEEEWDEIESSSTFLASKHEKVDDKNWDEYCKLKNKNPELDEKILTVTRNRIRVTGKEEFMNFLHPADSYNRLFANKISVCSGTRIMITLNDSELGIFNGQVGVVESVEKEWLTVDFNDERGPIPIAKKLVHVKVKGEQFYVDEVSGFTLQYGWAMTIHKMQGATIDRLVVDPNKMFTSGQLYVALSRVRNSSGLFLKGKIPANSLIYNPEVEEVYSTMPMLKI